MVVGGIGLRCRMALLAPTATPLLSDNSSEFEPDHTLVAAYVS